MQVDLDKFNGFVFLLDLAVYDRTFRHRMLFYDIDNCLGADTAAVIRRHGNGCRAKRYCSDETVLINSGHLFIRRAPGHASVFRRQRIHCRRQLNAVQTYGRNQSVVLRIDRDLTYRIRIVRLQNSDLHRFPEIYFRRFFRHHECITVIQHHKCLIIRRIQFLVLIRPEQTVINFSVGRNCSRTLSVILQICYRSVLGFIEHEECSGDIVGSRTVDPPQHFQIDIFRSNEETFVFFKRSVVDIGHIAAQIESIAVAIHGNGISLFISDRGHVLFAFFDRVRRHIDRIRLLCRDLAFTGADDCSRFVAGIVSHKNRNRIVQRIIRLFDRERQCLTGFALFRNIRIINGLSGRIHYRNICYVLIIMERYGDLITFGVCLQRFDGRSGIVDLQREAEEGTFAKNRVGITALQQLLQFGFRKRACLGTVQFHGIVFRDGIAADVENIAFLKSQISRCRTDRLVNTAGRIDPLDLIDVEEDRILRTVDRLCQDLIRHVPVVISFPDHHAGSACPADQVIMETADQRFGADRKAVRREHIFDRVRVAGEDGRLLRAFILDQHVVGFRIIAIRHLLVAVQNFRVRVCVIHGSIREAAVEAKQRNGVFHIEFGTVSADALAGYEGIALDPHAARIIGIIPGRNVDGHDHVLAGTGRNQDRIGIFRFIVHGVEPAQQQDRVVGSDLAVFVQISHGRAQIQVGAVTFATQVIQDRLHVVRIGIAVLIHVVETRGLREGISDLAVHVDSPFIHVDEALITEHILCEQIGPEVIDQVISGGIVDGEGIAVLAVRALAEFCLDLAVASCDRRIILHHDEGLCGKHIADIGKTRALTKDRIIGTRRLFDQRYGSGHQQAVRQLTFAECIGAEGRIHGSFQMIAVVFAEQRHHAGHLRRRHGGTGHVFVSAVRHAVDRPDVAAGCGDLRLQQQRTAAAPGAEIRHRRGAGIGHERRDIGILDFDLAGKIIIITGSSLCGSIRHSEPVLQAYRYAREIPFKRAGTGVIRKGHEDLARLIVDDDDRSRLIRNGIVDFLNEGDVAAEDHHDFPFQRDRFIDRCVFFRFSETVDQHVIIVAGDLPDLRVAVEDRGILLGIRGGFPIKHDLIAVEDERQIRPADVFRRGYGQGIDEGTRAAAGGHVDVFDIVVRVCRIDVSAGIRIVEGIGVAGGSDHDQAFFRQSIHVFLIVFRESKSRHGSAERQVHRVAAQDDGVFDRNEVIAVVRAAAFAKNFRGQDLCIGSNAAGKDCLQRILERTVKLHETVCGSNAGNMGAVLALFVGTVVGDIVAVDIVVGKRDLKALVGLCRIQAFARVQLRSHRRDIRLRQQVVVVKALAILGQGIFQRLSAEGKVILVGTGINDHDLAAGAVKAVRPGNGIRSDHAGGVAGIRFRDRGCIEVLNDKLLDAADARDLDHVAAGHIRRNDVRAERDVPLNVQFLAGHLLDLVDQHCLLGLQVVPVRHRAAVVRNVLHRIACLNGAGLIQYDGHAEHFRKIDGLELTDFFLFPVTEFRHLQIRAVFFDARSELIQDLV